MTQDRLALIAEMQTAARELGIDDRFAYAAQKEFAKRFPAQEVTLKLGVGVAFTLAHHRGIPLHMTPARGRGAADFQGKKRGWGQYLEIDGTLYLLDPCASKKIDDAIRLAVTAFLRADSPAQAAELIGGNGTCCCCGATLTDPTSRIRGIGPECIRKPFAKWFLLSAYGTDAAPDFRPEPETAPAIDFPAHTRTEQQELCPA